MAERIFGTDGLRGHVNTYPLTAEMALRLGLAAGTVFRSSENRRKVIIGKDTRLSGYLFESALTAGLCASGMNVYQVGPLPTPAIAFLTRNMRADFGIVISASHNPYHDNGIKFFDRNGFKLPDEIENRMSDLILDRDHKWNYPPSDKVGRASRIVDASGRYIVYLKSSFPLHLTLEGLRIVIDCANGANYKVAPLALEELGAEVFTLGTSPDGLNINQQCGSLFPEKMQAKVHEVRADIGLALDGDADRLIVCDEKGRILDGDQLLAICAEDLMKKGKLPGNILVGTVMSNMALDIFMKEHGGKLLRSKVGDRYVIETMLEHDAMLGGEQSGHLIFREYGTTGDGLLAALQLLRIMIESGKPISELADKLKPYPQHLINVKVTRKTPFDQCEKLMAAKKEAEKKLGEYGRVLLRYSGTENLCRIMVEGRDDETVKRTAVLLSEIAEEELR